MFEQPRLSPKLSFNLSWQWSDHCLISFFSLHFLLNLERKNESWGKRGLMMCLKSHQYLIWWGPKWLFKSRSFNFELLMGSLSFWDFEQLLLFSIISKNRHIRYESLHNWVNVRKDRWGITFNFPCQKSVWEIIKSKCDKCGTTMIHILCNLPFRQRKDLSFMFLLYFFTHERRAEEDLSELSQGKIKMWLLLD